MHAAQPNGSPNQYSAPRAYLQPQDELELTVESVASSLWHQRIDVVDWGYSIDRAYPSSEGSVQNQSPRPEPDIAHFIQCFTQWFRFLEYTEPEVEEVLQLVINHLPTISWREEERDSRPQQLYGGEGMELAVGYVTSWRDLRGPDLDHFCANPDEYVPLLKRKLKGDNKTS